VTLLKSIDATLRHYVAAPAAFIGFIPVLAICFQIPNQKTRRRSCTEWEGPIFLKPSDLTYFQPDPSRWTVPLSKFDTMKTIA
jgi:hypothetical protein